VRRHSGEVNVTRALTGPFKRSWTVSTSRTCTGLTTTSSSRPKNPRTPDLFTMHVRIGDARELGSEEAAREAASTTLPPKATRGDFATQP